MKVEYNKKENTQLHNCQKSVIQYLKFTRGKL